MLQPMSEATYTQVRMFKRSTKLEKDPFHTQCINQGYPNRAQNATTWQVNVAKGMYQSQTKAIIKR